MASMARIALLLTALCAVKVMSISRSKRDLKQREGAVNATGATKTLGASVGAGAEAVAGALGASGAPDARGAGEALRASPPTWPGRGGRRRNDAAGEIVKTMRKSKRKKSRSTSSSSGEKKKDATKEGHTRESLEISDDSESSTKDTDEEKKKDKKRPRSTVERHGWRAWHRKCNRCYEDEKKKWRDPSIKWICGGYQRARRSFKSECMMHYRNCQDGTMFVMIHAHRCENSSATDDQPRGRHFFYDYNAPLSGESSDSEALSDESVSDSTGSSS